ncbi:hypothetical protein [Halofilum ochraceum]|uniref:hypothetical protein n=1 Tax=Halofilum ochraceum TaxID=1611323 RepID=UPI0008DB1DC6|nr:hypothetical protein [Halofilum ochraceum]
MRKRIDRYVEDALVDFGDWYIDAEWYGKERDCVNMYALGFLARNVQKGVAIEDMAQIRIESPVPQPPGYKSPTAHKDLTVWSDGLSTSWDQNWEVADWPRIVMEWKFKRIGKPPTTFDEHDTGWLRSFTAAFEDTFGYVIRVYDGSRGRVVDWAKITRGILNATNRRS